MWDRTFGGDYPLDRARSRVVIDPADRITVAGASRRRSRPAGSSSSRRSAAGAVVEASANLGERLALDPRVDQRPIIARVSWRRPAREASGRRAVAIGRRPRATRRQRVRRPADNRRPADSARDDTTADSALDGPRDGRGTRRNPDDPADRALDVPEGPGHDR